jgi:hypothetical protein
LEFYLSQLAAPLVPLRRVMGTDSHTRELESLVAKEYSVGHKSGDFAHLSLAHPGTRASSQKAAMRPSPVDKTKNPVTKTVTFVEPQKGDPSGHSPTSCLNFDFAILNMFVPSAP